MSFDLCFGCVWIGLFIPDFVEVRRNMVEAGDNQCRTVSSSFKVAPWLYRLEILWASLLSGDHRWRITVRHKILIWVCMVIFGILFFIDLSFCRSSVYLFAAYQLGWFAEGGGGWPNGSSSMVISLCCCHCFLVPSVRSTVILVGGTILECFVLLRCGERWL